MPDRFVILRIVVRHGRKPEACATWVRLPSEWVGEGAVRTALGVLSSVRASVPSTVGVRALAWLPESALCAAPEGPLAATVLHVYADAQGWVALLDAGGTSLRVRLAEARSAGDVLRLTQAAPALILSCTK